MLGYDSWLAIHQNETKVNTALGIEKTNERFCAIPVADQIPAGSVAVSASSIYTNHTLGGTYPTLNL